MHIWTRSRIWHSSYSLRYQGIGPVQPSTVIRLSGADVAVANDSSLQANLGTRHLWGVVPPKYFQSLYCEGDKGMPKGWLYDWEGHSNDGKAEPRDTFW